MYKFEILFIILPQTDGIDHRFVNQKKCRVINAFVKKLATCKLVDMRKRDSSGGKISYKMTIHFDVFNMFMIDRIDAMRIALKLSAYRGVGEESITKIL